jgi:hypothetical protein
MAKKRIGGCKRQYGFIYCFEKDLLPRREAALRGIGYRVFSTTSEACVRFEIQMGQCGVLLLCYTIPDAVRQDLVELFERHCHSGVIASVMQPVDLEQSVETTMPTRRVDSQFEWIGEHSLLKG